MNAIYIGMGAFIEHLHHGLARVSGAGRWWWKWEWTIAELVSALSYIHYTHSSAYTHSHLPTLEHSFTHTHPLTHSLAHSLTDTY